MPLNNPPYVIKADIRQEKIIKKPIVTQNDSVIFQIEVYENGVPYNLTGATTVSLASKRKIDSVTVVTPGTFLGNVATFELGSNELERAGEVFAKAQFYDVEDRLSTLTFSYMVQSDPTGAGFVPSVVEQTLIQSYFTDAQAKIDELSAVNVVELSARLDETDLSLADNSNQLNKISPDSTFNNNSFISNMASYIGLINTGYVADDATRFYLLPKDYVTAGAGGAIKIFADPFHLDQTKYRDLGIYFSQDQNGDTGYHNNGCYYLNVKIAGVDYADRHPDLVFSFQDGLQVGGRFVRIKNAFGTYACQIIGSGNLEMAHLDGTIRCEIHGSVGFRNGGYGLKFINQAGTQMNGMLSYGTSDRLRYDSFYGHDLFIDNVKAIEVNTKSTKFNNAVINTPKTVLGVSTVYTPDVSATNRLQFNHSAATTITNFINGADGQQLRILFSNSNCTIASNTTIRLAGGVNFIGKQWETMVLENFGGTWYEMSRSFNHV